MLLVKTVALLAAATRNVGAFKQEQLHRKLDDKKGGTDQPTSLPTITPTEISTIAPMILNHHEPLPEHINPLDEKCYKKNAEKLDICIEYFASDAPSVAHSDVPSVSPSAYVVYAPSPTGKPTRKDDVHSIVNDPNERVLIQIGYFDMSITIVSETEKQLRSHDAIVHYRQGGDLTRQYEHAAAKQHLHEIYTEHFLNPLSSLNLTFIDVGETNVSATCTRSSVFYGSVEFEKLDGYPDPLKIELDEVTSQAFRGVEKNMFLEEFRKYHRVDIADSSTYDVFVSKMDHSHDISSVVNEGNNNNEESSALPPIVGAVTGALTICIIGVAYFVYRKKNEKRRRRTHPKSSSPMRQILHRKIVGEFESDGEEVIDFRGDNLNDVYMDSGSIRSRSPGESFFRPRLEFHDETADNLRELGVDVEHIAISVERLSASECLEEEFVDTVSEMK